MTLATQRPKLHRGYYAIAKILHCDPWSDEVHALFEVTRFAFELEAKHKLNSEYDADFLKSLRIQPF